MNAQHPAATPYRGYTTPRPTSTHRSSALEVRPTVSARGLTKTYGPTTALSGVDLDLWPGEAVAVMGASGSGKSTLLHCMAGVITPDTGSVLLETGHGVVDVVAGDAEQRAAWRLEHLGFVFQQGLLLPELTAVENVALPLILSGVDRSAAVAHASTWMRALGLDGLEERRLGQLSGGQQQRVAIARAQVGDPALVVADEPTGALDSTTSAEVMRALLDSTTGRGRTLVVVTHDRTVAGFCDRVIHLADGRVVAEEATR
ncbi:ABC transporter ATP-binding protein [Ornithinimicrobium panacihumi]|uniref:ABC transporter ATP-binding protein n=1 Tax=Ornithinimicrobium panacihumi TaxID=2008449 RepID=UPI003F898F96